MWGMTASLSNSDEIARAEAQVAEQRAQLARSLRVASQSGEKFARRLGNELKPAVTVGIVLAGTVAVVGLAVVLVKRGGQRRGWRAPSEPSLVSNAAKAAGLWALRLLAKRVAQEVVSRLGEPSAPELVAAAPNQVQR
jgi:hypothetical protein